MYKGKEVCQGCKTSGEKRPRFVKTDLCISCEEALNIGKSDLFEKNVEYILIQDWYHGFPSIDFDDRSLDALADSLFSSYDNVYSKTIGPRESTKRAQCHGSVHYKIPRDVFTALTLFLGNLSLKIQDIKQLKINSESSARIAVATERTRIYNEGIEKGRDLLFQLNSGEITVEEFNKKVTY